jgi:hypothetical protein
VRHFPESGYQCVELLGVARRREPTRVGAPVRFADRLDAVWFLRRIAPDAAGMASLRAVAFEEADSVVSSHATDAEVIDLLAARLCSGALRAEVTRRPTLHPMGGAVDEPEQKREAKSDKQDQDVEFEITDHWDEPFKDLEWVLIWPDGKTKKSGKLGADGTVKESSVPAGSYQLLFKIVSAARWGDARVEVGKEVKLLATASGFDPGASGKFEIFGDRALDRKPLAKIDGTVSAARVLEGKWTPDEGALKDVATGKLVFRARMGTSQAMSSAVPVVKKHSFDLDTSEGPLPDTTVCVRFSDGHEETARSKGGKLEVLVPLGQKLCWLHLPDMPGAFVALEPDDGDPREYLLHDASGDRSGEASGSGGEVDEAEEDDEEDEDEDEEEEASS